MENIEKIKPSGIFTNYIFKSIPLAFDESMSYYETLCGVLKLLREQETIVNQNADALIELENYVVHYFDNLDVQDEINNKLDEMAENGTLAEIIEDYATIPQLTARVTTAEDKIDTLEDNVDNLQLGLINDEIIIVGDSYLAGQSLTNPSTENYGYLLMQKLGMNTNNFHIWAEGGSSFTNPGNQNHNWLQIVQSRISEVTPANITKLIFAGGYNDIVANSPANITTAMANTINTCKSLFPNAKIYVDLIGNNGATSSNGSSARNLLKNRIYNVYSTCANYGAIFIDKGQLAIQDYSLYENNTTAVHPNAQGQIEIANWLYQCLKYGSVDYTKTINAYNGTTPSNFTGSIIFAEKLFNDKVQLQFYTDSLVGTIASGENNINFGAQPLRMIKHNAIATGNMSELGFIRIGNSTTNVYHWTPANWFVDSNNNLHLQFENHHENINKIISNWFSFSFDVNKI